MKILVTGSNGQVGKSLAAIAPNSTFDFEFSDRSNLDLSKIKEIDKKLQLQSYAAIINCAAYTQVDQAESEPELAKIINVNAVRALAKHAMQQKIPFIHLSSDYVYHPEHELIMKESEICNPQGIYAETKLNGDQSALEVNPQTVILRTSWVYAKDGKNFVNTISNLASKKDNLTVVHDQVGSPTFAPDIAEAIICVLNTLQTSKDPKNFGVFHFSNEGFISWYDFATEIVRITESSCLITPCSSSQYPTPAKRPQNSRLSKSKFENIYGLKMKNWKESLKICLEK